ncbi:MAG TPA: hypothetical protein VMW52_10010, partial [Phycisphaerae bacterium]|nr:hypothetical protein [Phycisphaerae bacterium]
EAERAGGPMPAPTGGAVNIELADSLERWFKRQEAQADETLVEIKRQTAVLEKQQATPAAAQGQLGVGGEAK